MIKNEEHSISNCGCLNQLFDSVRVVNPFEKIIIKKDDNSVNVKGSCFNIWNRKQMCENCISIRAYNENNSFLKIEYNGKRIYWVMATPINIDNNRYVMETIKDITDCNIIMNEKEKTAEEISFEIQKMNKLVVTDELTECFNRRYIKERLPVDMQLAKRNKKDLSIAMLDIDYFKKINDNYGHLVGDYILKKVINLINNNIRVELDWVARYGGEEILLVFNNTSKEKSIILANRIRGIIEDNIFKYKDNKVKLTISLGVATMNEEIDSIEKFINVADKNLYKAKKSGRNLVIG